MDQHGEDTQDREKNCRNSPVHPISPTATPCRTKADFREKLPRILSLSKKKTPLNTNGQGAKAGAPQSSGQWCSFVFMPSGKPAGVNATDVDAARNGDLAVDNQNLAVIRMLEEPVPSSLQRIDRIEFDDLNSPVPQALKKGSGLSVTDSTTAVWRSRMSDGATDRFNRSMTALLCFGDNCPLAETIWRGSWAVGAASIFSETFGKVAHPLLRPRMETDRRNKRRNLMNVPFNPDANSFMLSQGYLQLNGSSPLDDSDQDDDNGDDQQNVNKIAHRIAGHQPQQPQNYQNDSDRPQHRISLLDG
jgi:hypothetical protein